MTKSNKGLGGRDMDIKGTTQTLIKDNKDLAAVEHSSQRPRYLIAPLLRPPAGCHLRRLAPLLRRFK